MRYLKASFLVSLIYSYQVEAEPLPNFDCLVTLLELKAIFSESFYYFTFKEVRKFQTFSKYMIIRARTCAEQLLSSYDGKIRLLLLA